MSNLRKQSIETTVDLTDIKDVNDKIITDVLRSRFSSYHVYTNVGSCNLIAINPFKPLALNDAQTSEEYVASYKNVSTDNPINKKLNPHIFELTNRAYFHMRRTGNDQAIFLCGESGSGKSELRNLIVRHIVNLSTNKKRSKVQNQIINGQKVLEAFGSAKTTFNEKSASRFGVYLETHFSERGRMVGAKTLHYFLEKSRVTDHKKSEGNFNVFYWLLAGTTPDEKQVLQLEDLDTFSYLSRYGRPILPTDKEEYNELKGVMRAAGFKREHFSRITQVLSAILHLGNITFLDTSGIGTEEAVMIKNEEALGLAADFLGLEAKALQTVLTFKTTMVGRDVTTLILDAQQATAQRDELAQTLYSLLFSWIVEKINQKTFTENFNSFVGVLDFPGTQPSGFGSVGFEQFCIDYANERMYNFLSDRIFEADDTEFESEAIQVPKSTYKGNSDCIKLHERPSRGVCAIFNKMSEKTMSGKRICTDLDALEAINKYNSDYNSLSNKTSDTGARQFAIQHFSGEVTYDPTGFISKNNNQLLVDFITLFRGNADMPSSWSYFALELFSNENLPTDIHSVESNLVTTQQSSKPTRLPSMRKSKRGKTDTEKVVDNSAGKKTVLSQIQSALDDLVGSFEEAAIWTVFCIRPNATENTTQFDSIVVQSQVKALNLDHFATRMKYFYLVSLPHEDFLSRYAIPLNSMGLVHDGSAQAQCESVKQINQWSDMDMAIGTNKIFLSYSSWQLLEDKMRSLEKQDQKINSGKADQNMVVPEVLNNENGLGVQTIGAGTFDPVNDFPLPSVTAYSVGRQSYYSDNSNRRSMMNNESFYGENSESHYAESRFADGSFYNNQGDLSRTEGTISPPQLALPNEDLNATEERPSSMTPGRKRWLWFVWGVTFWIPSFFLIKCGRMKRKDVRIAWREKVALCAIIAFMCAFVIWFLVFFGSLICPKQDVFSVSELNQHNSAQDGYVAIRGEVFNLGNFAPHHFPSVVPTSSVLQYVGKDATDLFPVQVSDLCENVSPYVSLDYTQNYTDPNAQYHDFRYKSGNYRANWYYDQMTLLRRNYKVGDMGVEMKGLDDQAKGAYTLNGAKQNRAWAVIDHRVYDLTTYILGGRYLSAPPGEAVPGDVSVDFLDQSVVDLFQQHAGTDITERFNSLSLDSAQKYRELVCLRNLYFAGLVDDRNSTKCQFSTYFLLAVTICLCIVIFFKFVAALRVGTPKVPEELNKFVICQVTCYTEDEESLRKTIDSLATLRYDDKRKLIVVICDGMIIGSGNDRPTPRIVLDIFGVDPQVDPEALSFLSVGEGMKQHNRAKIYSGLYEVNGHVVPYLVIAKVGAPNERQKPGNRGKRDSQLVLMQFLNRLQYDAPMNPMQLEMYHQMKNVIGVNPIFYEYVLMVDADTEVMPDGLNYLVSSMSHDAKVIGLCGETTLANEKDTWVTMIQVYEYFISHHMIKSFESLFSTVSCLPGCFTMYRVRTVDGKRPLFVANEIIEDYTINVVDTLHKKNLLYLGEDRYLTTLLLKHFPNYKTKFNPDAQCKTNAPDTWDVLISQRRRWINSTVHNLSELVFLPRLCGFCCFSMRFVVMLDLFSTLVQPALLGYLGYLIYALTQAKNQIPYITIITLCCTYGLQIIIFIMNKRWEYIVWFFVSILALPVFSFWIPIYSYWHFDDFSWGNTRVVVGEKGKKLAVADEGEFDPKSIPLMSWSDYEKTMLSDTYSDVLSQQGANTPMSLNGGPAYSVGGGHSKYGGYSPNNNRYSYHSAYLMGGNQPFAGSVNGEGSVNGGPINSGSVAGGSIVNGGYFPSGYSVPGGYSVAGESLNEHQSVNNRYSNGTRFRHGPTMINDPLNDNTNVSNANSFYSQNPYQNPNQPK